LLTIVVNCCTNDTLPDYRWWCGDVMIHSLLFDGRWLLMFWCRPTMFWPDSLQPCGWPAAPAFCGQPYSPAGLWQPATWPSNSWLTQPMASPAITSQPAIGLAAVL
jgi:hypothetical protein